MHSTISIEPAFWGIDDRLSKSHKNQEGPGAGIVSTTIPRYARKAFGAPIDDRLSKSYKKVKPTEY